jgi:poly(A) polymerase Pap1
MMKEFQRADGILKKEKIQKSIFKKSNFFGEFEEFVQIELFGDSNWNSYFESKIVKFMVDLEKINNLRAVPFVLPYKLKKSTLYFISIEFVENKRTEFQFLLFDFINYLNEWNLKTDDDYLIINHLKRSELKIKI